MADIVSDDDEADDVPNNDAYSKINAAHFCNPRHHRSSVVCLKDVVYSSSVVFQYVCAVKRSFVNLLL